MTLFRVHGVVRQALDKSFGSSGKKLSGDISGCSSTTVFITTSSSSSAQRVRRWTWIGENSRRMELVDSCAGNVHEIVHLPLTPTDPALQFKSMATSIMVFVF